MGTGVLFDFVNFAQTQVIFYSKLTSKNLPFCFICAVVFNRDYCGESCAPSRNLSPSQKTVKNCCPIYKKAAEDASQNGKNPRRYLFIGSGFSWWCPFQVTCLWNLFFAFCGKLLCYTPNTVFMVCSIKDWIACWLYPFSDALTI